MDDPTQQEDPEDASEHELNDGDEKPALDQLAKPRDKKAAERRDHIPSRSLSSHVLSKVVMPERPPNALEFKRRATSRQSWAEVLVRGAS